MENKKIAHTIVIDSHMKVILEIPEILDASELKALMIKTNKMFNLSDVSSSFNLKKVYKTIRPSEWTVLLVETERLRSKGQTFKKIAETLDCVQSTLVRKYNEWEKIGKGNKKTSKVKKR